MATRTCTFVDRRAQLRCTECGLTLDLCVCPAPDEQAFRRIASNEGTFLNRVRAEIALADERAEGNQFLSVQIHKQAGIVSGLLLSHHDGQGASPQEILQALVQTAVLVTRLAIEGDGEFSYEPRAVFGEDAPTR